MEDLLDCKDMANILENEGIKSNEVTNQVWQKMHKETIEQIKQRIDHSSVLHHVAQGIDTYALQKKLENMYQHKTARNKTLLMRQVLNLKLRGDTSIAIHLQVSKPSELTWSVKLNIGDEEQVLLFLNSLPDN